MTGAALLGALAAPLAAQGAAAAPAASVARAHTAADTRFFQGMIAHHAQAVTMSAWVAARTERAPLRLLAERITVSQRDEIRLMQQWLRDHEEAVPAADGALPMPGSMDHAAMAAHGAHGALHPGMLSPEEMQALEAATGDAFVRLFLAGMIKHHQGAITMVRELFAVPGAGQDPATFNLASDIEADQTAEIARMRALLATIR
ncbi:MAG: DUF305 domain-containing protein [Gemmatimonadaceae bacterium]|nr:DUF305 domain-containing protein [Gemmatimonadaceae bacterium]